MSFNMRENLIQIVDGQTSAMDIVHGLSAASCNEEPFYVADLSDIVRKHKLWKLALPRVEPFYAVKCNDKSAVLELLSALGTGFDCASKGEIQKMIDLGVDSSRIIYANPCKTLSFIKYAAAQGVSLMTFDNEAELHKVKAVFPDAEMVIRIRVQGKARCPLGIKFGIEKENALELLKVAKDLGVNVVGVSFHVGSGCEDAQTYQRALEAAREVFDFAQEIGFDFNLLDIGGGFPGQENAPLTFNDIAKIVNDNLDKYFPSESNIRIIAEPGRYYVASAFTLCVNVIAKREVRDQETSEAAYMYYVNDGVYGSFNCILFDHAEVLGVPLKDYPERKVTKCSIWGPTCDSMDRITESTDMSEMDVGEWMVFKDMGAYTVAAASTFNGFQNSSVHYIASRSTWLYLQLLMVNIPMKLTAVELPAMKSGIDVAIDDAFIDNFSMNAPEMTVVDV